MVKAAGLVFLIAVALCATAGLASGADANAEAQQHGSTATGCPSSAPTPTPVATDPVHGVLVLPGATTVLLCRYRGLNPAASAHRLERARLLTAAKQLTQLTAEFDALPQLSGVIHCPMDDGSEITALFGYARAAPATVYVGLSGCRTVSRGQLVRSASGPAGSRLIAELSALDP